MPNPCEGEGSGIKEDSNKQVVIIVYTLEADAVPARRIGNRVRRVVMVLFLELHQLPNR